MATTSASALSLFLLALSLFALTATARPCKTLFFYTTTTSYYPATTATTTSFPQNPNPNFEILPNFPKSHSYSPKFLTFFFTTVNTREEARPYVSYVSFRRARTNSFPLYLEHVAEEEKQRSSEESSVMPLGIYSSVTTSSIRDRTKDIMSVVGALLFGVGCGALTAATMFFVWSLFSPHRFDFDDSDDDDDGYDNGDDAVSPKKIGYIAIPEDVNLVKKKDYAPQ